MQALRLIDGWEARNVAAGLLTEGGRLETYGEEKRSFRWASVTKLVTAFAALIAIEEGTLDLAAAAGPPGSTVRHLLAHASGLPFFEDGPGGAPAERRIYSNVGFNLLGVELATAADMPFEAYVQAAVFEPLGMSGSRLRLDEKYGVPAAGGYGTLEDLLVFARELMTPTLVARETLDEAVAITFPGLDGVLPGFGRQQPNDWGLGLEIRGDKSPHWTGTRNSPRTFGHFGGSGTFLWVDPEARCSLVCLTNRAFDEWAVAAWPPFSDAVLAELSGESGQPAPA